MSPHEPTWITLATMIPPRRHDGAERMPSSDKAHHRKVTASGVAEAFVGIVVGHGRLPIRLHFTLADGRDFHLPISDIALRQLAVALAALRPSRAPISDKANDHTAARQVEGALADTRALPPK